MCKQIKMIIFSLLVLCLIFVCTKEEKTEISSMECISVEKIEEMIQGKEELKEFPEILYDGNPVALDAKSRTIYIPQSMNDLEWTGELM